VLRGVRADSTTDAWAVGDYNNGTVDKTLILHWGGSHWRVWPSPNVRNRSNDLNAIGGTSSANAYAVGITFGGTGSTALILHWGGSHWRVMPSPDVGTSGNDLNAVFALSPASVWAAGEYNNSGPDQTLIDYCG
jgi:hypothetical protein